MPGLFLYGTLCHRPLLETVLGGAAAVRMQPARLPGYRVFWADGQSFPAIRAAPEGAAEGWLVDGLDDAAMARLDFYEGGFGYRLVAVQVETEAGAAEARVYMAQEDAWPAGAPWSLDEWVERWGATSLRAAEEVMDYFGRDSAEAVARLFPQIRIRAASWARARAEVTPNEIRAGFRDADVERRGLRRPYSSFFMIEEQDLRFPYFDGGLSDTVERAGFVSGDAVTLLPYDPVRDRVLVVEQFRMGPYVRGDRHPWMLEPIAGRIDPGETPEQAAAREAREESGVGFDRLEFVGRYYVSPGAVTEYLYSYVAITALPAGSDWTGGEVSETEDIRSIVLDFDALMQAVDSGEAETAPLILTAHWLARNRGRLRAAA